MINNTKPIIAAALFALTLLGSYRYFGQAVDAPVADAMYLGAPDRGQSGAERAVQTSPAASAVNSGAATACPPGVVKAGGLHCVPIVSTNASPQRVDEFDPRDFLIATVISDALSGGAQKLPDFVMNYLNACLQMAQNHVLEAEPLCEAAQRQSYEQAFLTRARSLANAGDAHAQYALGLWHLTQANAQALAKVEKARAAGVRVAHAPGYENADYETAAQYFSQAASVNEDAKFEFIFLEQSRKRVPNNMPPDADD